MFKNIIGGILQPGGGLPPNSFAGLEYWFDATTLVLSDTNPVGTWPDLSGNARDLTGAGGTRPLYRTNRINGKPTVLFDGTDDFLETAPFTLNQPVHIFAVLSHPTYTAGRRVIDGTGGNDGLVYIVGAGSTLELFCGASGPQVSPTPANGAYMLRCQMNGATSKMGFGTNGYVTGDSGTANPMGLTMAARGTSHATPSNTEFGEIFAYSSILSAANETAILAYLTAKWGT